MARTLQARGDIRYRRGLGILDRTGLEAMACECYGVAGRTYEQRLAAPVVEA